MSRKSFQPNVLAPNCLARKCYVPNEDTDGEFVYLAFIPIKIDTDSWLLTFSSTRPNHRLNALKHSGQKTTFAF